MEKGKYILKHSRQGTSASIQLGAKNILVVEGRSQRKVSVQLGEKPSTIANPILLEFTKRGFEISDIRTEADKIAPDAGVESYKPSVDDWFAEIVTIEGDTAIVDAGKARVGAKATKAAKAVVAKMLKGRPRKLWLREYAPLDKEPFASFKDWTQAIAAFGSDSVEEIVIDSGDTLTRQASVVLGNLSALLSACPNLRQAKLLGTGYFETMDHNFISSLTFLGDNLKSTAIAGLFQSSLPELRSLHLGLSYEQTAKRKLDEELITGLRSTSFRLNHLSIGYPHDPFQLLEKLFHIEIWKKIPSISVEANLDTEKAVEFLKKHQSQLARLQSFALDLAELTHEERAWIATQLPNMSFQSDSVF